MRTRTTHAVAVLRRRRPRGGSAASASRPGVASVLAMMFLVMFSSLAVAMAVASQGNVRTAQTHLHVTQALSAAETGLAVAEKKLDLAVSRFIIDRGTVNTDLGKRLWSGTYTSSDGRVVIATSNDGRFDSMTTRGISDAIFNAHAADSNLVLASGLPTANSIFDATDADSSVFYQDNWVRTAVIAIDADATSRVTFPAAYQITYAPLANGTDVRVIVTGYSSIGLSGSTYQWGNSASSRAARPVTRTVQQDFRIVKQPKHAMLSPSRIMIGKNVMVTGNLGARYNDVTQTNGDPVQTKSDFSNIDTSLDAKLTRLNQGIDQYDVDGDNRLRVSHPTESQGLPGAAELTSRSWPSGAFSDATRDGYVDDFDVFINHYDANRDGEVVLSTALTTGTPNAGRSAEFTSDDDLAFLIDSGSPDRNRNGLWGYTDPADNNRVSTASALLDVNDQVLGYRDGVINYKDQYAKIRGQLSFRTSKNAWSAARGGSYGALLRGPIVPGQGQTSTKFNASNNELPEVDASSFSDSRTPLQTAADGASFDTQVSAQLGISASQLATYTELGANATAPQYWRSDLTNAYVVSKTGQNLWERMPFNAPTYADFYVRPRYVNMTFKNVQIPMGNNGLFVNCKFIGVTFVRSYADNTHTNWSLYGTMEWSNSAGGPVFKNAPLDKSDFPRYTTSNVADGPLNYDQFPDPPTINGSIKLGAQRNTKLYSNNIRFHDSLFVGSVVSDVPASYTNLRNKLQFTGATRFTTVNPDAPTNATLNPDPDDLPEINKSSMMAPNYSVDVGQFNAPTDTFTGSGAPAAQNIQLRGTIVAGVLDVRGNALIDGALFLTFAPTAGQGPLQQMGSAVGNPANFNATLGYFGPQDGDGEAIDPTTLPVVGGVRITGYDTNADGIPDVGPNDPQPAGSTAIPFYGFGRIRLNWNPDLPMPDGILLPLSVRTLTFSYKEGK
jgi:hypothetical protein